MPELAEHSIFSVRYSSQEERVRSEKRRAVENLTKVGSFQAHSAHPILEPAKSEQKEPQETPRYVFQGFGVGGGSVLDVSLGSTTVSGIGEMRLLPSQGAKIVALLSRETPDLMIMDLKLPPLLSPENVFSAGLFPIVTRRSEGPKALAGQVRPTTEGEEIYVHPVRSFFAEPIPTIRRSIHLREEMKSALPPDDMPRQFSVRVNEEAE